MAPQRKKDRRRRKICRTFIFVRGPPSKKIWWRRMEVAWTRPTFNVLGGREASQITTAMMVDLAIT